MAILNAPDRDYLTPEECALKKKTIALGDLAWLAV
jgi:hypothetical protein